MKDHTNLGLFLTLIAGIMIGMFIGGLFFSNKYIELYGKHQFYKTTIEILNNAQGE